MEQPIESVPVLGDTSPPAPATPAIKPTPSQAPVESMPPKPAEVGKPGDFPSLGLSKEAVDKRLRRIFQPRADGTYQVSADFVKKYLAKGEEREKLLLMFEKCDYNPEDRLQQLLVLLLKDPFFNIPCFFGNQTNINKQYLVKL